MSLSENTRRKVNITNSPRRTAQTQEAVREGSNTADSDSINKNTASAFTNGTARNYSNVRCLTVSLSLMSVGLLSGTAEVVA